MGTILKLVGIGLACSLLPFIILAGFGAALGLNTLAWNDQPLHGWTAVAAAPFIGVFLTALFTVFFGAAIAFGLWVYSWIAPVSISYREEEQVPETG